MAVHGQRRMQDSAASRIRRLASRGRDHHSFVPYLRATPGQRAMAADLRQAGHTERQAPGHSARPRTARPMVRPILQGGAPSPATIDCSPSSPGSSGDDALADVTLDRALRGNVSVCVPPKPGRQRKDTHHQPSVLHEVRRAITNISPDGRRLGPTTPRSRRDPKFCEPPYQIGHPRPVDCRARPDHQGVTGEGTFSTVAAAARTVRSWPS
jgi:hypothetical protein